MDNDQKPAPSIASVNFPVVTFRSCIRLGATFLIGAVGGGLFYLLSMPLPWMLGAMLATTVLAMSGKPLERPIRMRLVMLSVLGVTLGSSFTPDVLARSAGWGGSMATMTGFIVIVSSLSFLLIRKRFGMDRATAFFSSVPAGVNDMVVVGSAMGGDERTIALIHSIRILLTVLVIPLIYRFTMGATSSGGMNVLLFHTLALSDAGLLLLSGFAGYFIAKLLRFPAPAIIGPMFISAAFHLSLRNTSAPDCPY